MIMLNTKSFSKKVNCLEIALVVERNNDVIIRFRISQLQYCNGIFYFNLYTVIGVEDRAESYRTTADFKQIRIKDHLGKC